MEDHEQSATATATATATPTATATATTTATTTSSNAFPAEMLKEMLAAEAEVPAASRDASVFLSAVLEHITTDVLSGAADGARGEARERKRPRIDTRHIQDSLMKNGELSSLARKFITQRLVKAEPIVIHGLQSSSAIISHFVQLGYAEKSVELSSMALPLLASLCYQAAASGRWLRKRAKIVATLSPLSVAVEAVAAAKLGRLDAADCGLVKSICRHEIHDEFRAVYIDSTPSECALDRSTERTFRELEALHGAWFECLLEAFAQRSRTVLVLTHRDLPEVKKRLESAVQPPSVRVEHVAKPSSSRIGSHAKDISVYRSAEDFGKAFELLDTERWHSSWWDQDGTLISPAKVYVAARLFTICSRSTQMIRVLCAHLARRQSIVFYCPEGASKATSTKVEQWFSEICS